MGYISGEKRNKMIDNVDKSYAFRKFILVIELILLIGFVVFSILSNYHLWKFKAEAVDGKDWFIWIEKNDKKLIITKWGWIVLAWGAVVTILGIYSVFAILAMRSPKSTKSSIQELESIPLPGKKGKFDQAKKEVVESRISKKSKHNR